MRFASLGSVAARPPPLMSALGTLSAIVRMRLTKLLMAMRGVIAPPDLKMSLTSAPAAAAFWPASPPPTFPDSAEDVGLALAGGRPKMPPSPPGDGEAALCEVFCAVFCEQPAKTMLATIAAIVTSEKKRLAACGLIILKTPVTREMIAGGRPIRRRRGGASHTANGPPRCRVGPFLPTPKCRYPPGT